jgi:hypothetical protein
MLKQLSLILLLASSLFSAKELLTDTNIIQISSYATYNNGDITFRTATSGTICKGYWISKDMPGYSVISNMAISAYYSQASNLTINASSDASDSWPGLSEVQFCKVDSIHFKKGDTPLLMMKEEVADPDNP